MSSHFWLTDEPSDLSGYRRAVLGGRGDAPSLVRSVTATAAGPTSGIQVTRTSGGTALAWVTDPLDGTDLTAAAWTFHVWSKESSLAANAALRFQVIPWTVAEQTAALDDNNGTELTATSADYNRTTGNATATPLADGDRLVFKVLVDDAGTLVTGHTVTVSYGGQHPRAEGDSYIVCPDTLKLTATLPVATETMVRRVLRQEQETAAEATPGIVQAEVRRAFASAIEEYSRAKPRRLVAALSGDGTTYDFPLPARWVWGASVMESVEYPAGEQVATILDQDDWRVWESVTAGQPVRTVRFYSTPESGTDNILLRYTSRHVHTDELDTLPSGDLEAVCWLAGSVLAEWLSAEAAGSNDSTINADVVNYRDARDRWAKAANRLRERYQAFIGINREAPAGGAVRDLDPGLAWGADRLFHSRRWR